MRRWLAPSLFAVALLAAPALAEDAKTYTLPERETWKIGDVISRHEVNSEVEKRTVTGPDGKEMPEHGADQTKTTTYDTVLKVLAVDGEGRFTRAMVFVKAWSYEVSGKPADTSLTGKHLEVTGVGSDRKATVLGGIADVSDQGKEWVAEEFGKKSGEKEAKAATLLPGKPVAIGDEWAPEPAKLVAMFGEGGPSFLPDTSSAKLTLTGVKGEHAELTMAFHLQSGPMQTPNGPIEWKEGGALDMEGIVTKPLDGTKHTETGTMKGRFAGVGAMGPVTLDMNSTFEQSYEVIAGGEMPQPKQGGSVK